MTIEEEFKLYADDYYRQHEFVGFDEECWEKEQPVRDIIWPVRQKYGRVDNEELLQPFHDEAEVCHIQGQWLHDAPILCAKVIDDDSFVIRPDMEIMVQCFGSDMVDDTEMNVKYATYAHGPYKEFRKLILESDGFADKFQLLLHLDWALGCSMCIPYGMYSQYDIKTDARDFDKLTCE